MKINSSQLNSINNEKSLFHRLTLHNLNKSEFVITLQIWIVPQISHGYFSITNSILFADIFVQGLLVFVVFFFYLPQKYVSKEPLYVCIFICLCIHVLVFPACLFLAKLCITLIFVLEVQCSNNVFKCTRTSHSLQDFCSYQQTLTIHHPWKHYYITKLQESLTKIHTDSK